MENNLKIEDGKIILNGEQVKKVTAFRAETLYSENGTVSVSLTFEVPFRNLDFSNINFNGKA